MNCCHMLYKFIIFIFSILWQQILLADIQVVTTLTPIASIYKAIAQNRASVITIQSNSHSCAHHMRITPSQIIAARNADLFVYIDDAFEVSISKIYNNVNPDNVFKISTIPNLNLIKNNNITNWHLWLDINNIRLIGNIALKQLSTISPHNATYFMANHQQFLKTLNVISDKLHTASMHNAAYLSSSLDYLLSNSNVQFLDLDLTIVSNYTKLHKLVKDNNYTSLLIDDHEIMAKKLVNLLPTSVDVIIIDVENWSYDNANDDNSLLHNWNRIINLLQK